MHSNNLININKRVCMKLWDIIAIEDSPNDLTPKLVVPSLYNLTVDSVGIRISEQEARFMFCSELEKTNYFYSVETPTKGKYSFSGSEKISARSDISIYSAKANKLEHIANVELKAGNPLEKDIIKDIRKLIFERRENATLEGNWFHFLKNADSNTLNSLFKKFQESFNILASEVNLPDDSISIQFTFCVLDKKWACTKKFIWKSGTDLNEYVNSFFNIQYNIKNSNINVKNANGWEIFRKN